MWSNEKEKSPDEDRKNYNSIHVEVWIVLHDVLPRRDQIKTYKGIQERIFMDSDLISEIFP